MAKTVRLGFFAHPESAPGAGLWQRIWFRLLNWKYQRAIKSNPESLPLSTIEAVDRHDTPDQSHANSLLWKLSSLALPVKETLWLPDTAFSGLDKETMMSLKSWKRRGFCDVNLYDGSAKRILSHCDNQNTRRLVFEGIERCRTQPGYSDAVTEILKKRKIWAKNLGFGSFGDLMASNCGMTSAQVVKLIESASRDGLRMPVNRVNMWDEDYLQNRETQRIDKALNLSMLLPTNPPTVCRAMEIAGDIFGVRFHLVTRRSWWRDGWPSSFLIYRAENSLTRESLGFVYVELFKKSNSGQQVLPGATCIALGHVVIRMQMDPGQMLVKRFFEYEEFAALVHETSHAVHMLLDPIIGRESGRPLDIIEFPSVLGEVIAYQTVAIKKALKGTKFTPADVEAARRNVYSYLKIIRNIAVYEELHGPNFDPEKMNVTEFALKVAQRYWPSEIPKTFNILAEITPWFFGDYTTRAGYLINYLRAHTIVRRHGADVVLNGGLARDLQGLLSSELSPGFASEALEHRKPLHAFRGLDLAEYDPRDFGAYYSQNKDEVSKITVKKKANRKLSEAV